MRELIETSWKMYADVDKAGVPWLVRPATPILFFGDSVSYGSSKLRVITVGLNPSRKEFPPQDPFFRFPAARLARHDVLDRKDTTTYLSALNDYFRINPYDTWFKPSFEPFLRGMGASFYDGACSTALHTDICSPLPTDPTWSNLGSEKSQLESEGIGLWTQLVHRLSPNVVLISVAKHHLAKIRFAQIEGWKLLSVLERKNPYKLMGAWFDVGSSQPALFVFGRATQLPFGSVGATDKRLMGVAIREFLDARE